MRIESSAAVMKSERNFISYTERESLELTGSEQEAATLELSGESRGLLDQLKEEKRKAAQEQKEREEQNLKDWAARQRERAGRAGDGGERVKTAYDFKLEILQRMLDALRSFQGKGGSRGAGITRSGATAPFGGGAEAVRRGEPASGGGAEAVRRGEPASGGVQDGTRWTRTTVTSVFHTEAEYTSFQAAGVARTEDGREISFGVSVEMSRAFCARFESVTKEKYFCTDPLVINIDSGMASVTDQKFLFDLDCDGREENISFAGKGSGFLALDKNGDGRINDGGELFGTRSGDGFRDLAGYDEDGNGWIDENDEVFDRLKIWTKDEDGEDRLLSLRQADVGAIYLGNAETEFSLNEAATNKTNGVIRSTGIYLKEKGGAGTVQHVDLVI